MTMEFQAGEKFARELDTRDPLAGYRDRFHLPKTPDGQPAIYFCGNSLGLQPKRAREIVEQELSDWADLGVEGHFHGKRPWYSYHERFRESAARLVGAKPGEVVMMNGLTANLHLMMASFYRPTPERHKILIETPAFPSDIYAVKSQLSFHGYDPSEALVQIGARDGEHIIREEDIQALLEEQGLGIALVMLGSVNFFTGQAFDMERIANAGHAQGCVVGFDLAHAAGNLEMRLHDWNVDFAAWCSYKYLNSGPGGVAGCFVHERHGNNPELPRFAGWWGNDPETRFQMHLQPDFVPRAGVDGWQLSNPPILAMAPLVASMEIFDEAGMPALRSKSELLTAYLEWLLKQREGDLFDIVTPEEPSRRGCQLSLRVLDKPRERHAKLEAAGVVADFRPPDVIRVAPVPLYNTFRDAWRFADIISSI